MVNIVKIGGNVIDDPKSLEQFLKTFAQLPGPKILVHGGGKEATRFSREIGLQPVMIEGRRVTDAATIDIVTMVYAGLINKRIVALLQSYGCDAVGLTGADGNSIPATKRAPNPIDYGFVGDIDPSKVNHQFIKSLIEEGKTPVFCAICHNGEGMLLNCNADSVAASVAAGMSNTGDTRLTYCFEKPGVLQDIDDESSVIPLITAETFPKLKEQGVIADGMIPKIHNALLSASQGVKEVKICNASNLDGDSGTIIRTI